MALFGNKRLVIPAKAGIQDFLGILDPRVKPGDDIGAVFFTSRGSATLAFSLRRRVEVVPCGDRGLAILGGHVPAEEIEKATGEKCRVAFLETSTRGCRGDSWVRAAIAALGG